MMKQIIDKLRRHGLDVLLMLYAVFFFSWYMVRLMGVSGTETWEPAFPAIWLTLTAVLFIRGKAWRTWGSWILLAGLALISWRCMSENKESQEVAQQIVNTGFWAFGVCYHLGFGMSRRGTKRFLRLLIGLWTAANAAMAVTGLVCALFDLQVQNLNGTNFIGLSNARLQLMIYCTNTASNLVVAILAALVGLALTKNRLGRWLYFLALVVMALALGLTSTRTAYITLGLGLGVYGGFEVFHHKKLRDKRWLRAAVALACVAVIVVGVVAGLFVTVKGFNAVKQLTNALAETVNLRGFTSNEAEGGLLSWRTLVWKTAFEVLSDFPEYLLYGASVNGRFMKLVETYASVSTRYGFSFDHMHNLYLQVLVECGIPGLVLLVWFLVLFIRAAWRLLVDYARPAWVRMLPLLPIAALAAETMECLTLLRYNYPVLPFTVLFMALTIRAAKDKAFSEE